VTSPLSAVDRSSTPSTGVSALVQGLEKPADFHRDGHVTNAEFMKFLNDAIATAESADHSSSAAPAATPGIKGIK
jgi:hypothetical protein